MGLKRRAPARRAEQQPLRPSVRLSVRPAPPVCARLFLALSRLSKLPTPLRGLLTMSAEPRKASAGLAGEGKLRPAPGGSVVGDWEKRRWGGSGRRVVPARCRVPAPGDLCSLGRLRVFPWRPVKAQFCQLWSDPARGFWTPMGMLLSQLPLCGE